jgi:uncharacterized protein DUF6600
MRISALVAVGLLALGCVAAPAPVPPPPPSTVTSDVFVTSLAPYGEWTGLSPYGRVWRPLRVAAGWRPYLFGAWVWTDEGWYWETDEPWGWATYHYGRWAFDRGLGWVWVPGPDWAPAWVAWRTADAFVGWAPLPPGLDAWWADAFAIDVTWWCFVPDDRFVGVEVERQIVPVARVSELFPRSRPAPPREIARAPAPPRGGPTPQEIERRGGVRVVPVRIEPVHTPAEARGRGDGSSTRAYRPVPPSPRAAPAPPPSRERPEPRERGERER